MSLRLPRVFAPLGHRPIARLWGALGIAAFSRQPDGGFEPLGPAPDWFVTIFHSGISASAIMAVALNLFFNVFLPGVPDEPSGLAAGLPSG